MTLGLWPAKDPAEILDYIIDWTPRLAGSTIISSVWDPLPTGSSLVIGVTAYTTLMTKVWLSGGIAGQTYNLRNTITTAAGGTMVETAVLFIQAK